MTEEKLDLMRHAHTCHSPISFEPDGDEQSAIHGVGDARAHGAVTWREGAIRISYLRRFASHQFCPQLNGTLFVLVRLTKTRIPSALDRFVFWCNVTVDLSIPLLAPTQLPDGTRGRAGRREGQPPCKCVIHRYQVPTRCVYQIR